MYRRPNAKHPGWVRYIFGTRPRRWWCTHELFQSRRFRYNSFGRNFPRWRRTFKSKEDLHKWLRAGTWTSRN